MIRNLLWVTLALAVVYSGLVIVSRSTPALRSNNGDRARTEREAQLLDIYGSDRLRILNFYSRDASVEEGSHSVLCYGVVNAKSVRMEPPVEGMIPAISHCVEVPGEKATRYTLFAEGANGEVVSESFVLGTHANPDTLPEITAFNVISTSKDHLGRPVYLVSFGARNPEVVTIEPAGFPPLHRAPYGRFYVAPRVTTTYTLTVTGVYGHKVQKQLTLEGPK